MITLDTIYRCIVPMDIAPSGDSIMVMCDTDIHPGCLLMYSYVASDGCRYSVYDKTSTCVKEQVFDVAPGDYTCGGGFVVDDNTSYITFSANTVLSKSTDLLISEVITGVDSLEALVGRLDTYKVKEQDYQDIINLYLEANGGADAVKKSGDTMTGNLDFGSKTAGLTWTTADGTKIALRPDTVNNIFQVILKNAGSDNWYSVFSAKTDGTVKFTHGQPLSITSGGTEATTRSDAFLKLGSKGTVNGDFNEMKTAGWSWAQLPSCTNAPTETGYGWLEVLPFSNAVLQRFTNYNTRKVYIRSYVNSAWNAWAELALTTDVVSKSGDTINGILNIGGSLGMWSDSEGGQIEIKAGNDHTNTWQIDAYDGNLRFYTWRESDGTYKGIKFNQETGLIDAANLLNAYPVGSVVIRYDHTSPASLYGGTWQRITSRFLYGTGADGTIGETGGSSSITLKKANLPGESVIFNNSATSSGWSLGIWDNGHGSSSWYAMPKSQTSSTSVTALNINPPFIQVSIWRRTA